MKHITNKVLLAGAILSNPFFADKINAQVSNDKKNILFIAVDDLKPLIGSYGDNMAHTPNIDKLASRGSLFTNAYCQQAVSGPSRASLLTGMCPDNTQVWDLKTRIRNVNPEVVTLPQHFKRNGYHSVGIGKIYDPRSVDKQSDKRSWSEVYLDSDDYLHPDYGMPVLSQYQSEETKKKFRKFRKEAIENGKKGRDINMYVREHIKPSIECIDVPDNAYTDGAVALAAASYLEAYNNNKPFFFAVGFKKPHLPFVAPKKYWDLYKREDIELAEFQEKAIDSPDFAYHNSGELHSYTDIPALSSFSDLKNTVLDEDKARELIHGYYASVSYIDNQIGLLLDALEKKGLVENTIIILWGDHGWHLGDHGLWNKHSNFEQAARAPMIVVDPSRKPYEVTQPVEFLGIYPTLCDLVGIDKPEHLDGVSFSNLIKGGEPQKDQRYAVSQYHRGPRMGYSIRDKQYRYTVWVDWKNRELDFKNRLAVELYDYENDPLETKNMVNDSNYKCIVEQMERYWQDYIERRINK